MRMRSLLCASIAAAAIAVAAAQTAPAPPSTPVRPVTNSYQGVSVTDNYRWLEDGASPETKAWVAAQNAYTNAYVNALPQRPAILQFLEKTQQQEPISYGDFKFRHGHLFAIKFDPRRSGAFLVVVDNPQDKASEKTVADMNQFLPGKVLQVDWYEPSPDGTRIGMALSSGGSEEGQLYVVETATGKQIGEAIPAVQFGTGGGAMAWTGNGNSFYYTRYPQGNERPAADRMFYQQIYFHTLGTPSSKDTYVLGKDFPRVAETTLQASPDGKEVLASVANGDGGQYALYTIATANNQVRQVAAFPDKVVAGAFGVDDALWLLSHKQTDRGELLRLDPGNASLAAAKPVVRGDDASIEGSGSEAGRFVVTGNRLYVTVIRGGPEEVRMYGLDGKPLGQIPLPQVASVTPLVRLGAETVMYGAQTFTRPEAWYEYSGQGQPAALPFHEEAAVDFSDIEVRRVTATSKDGTQIPMTVMMRRGTALDGANPTLLTGYGGYAISMTPHFLGAGSRLWFNAGGVFAIGNLRGGAEYGEGWHQAGSLTQKQNVFDDFAACAQKLVSDKYTSPEHLAIEGGSNGGLLMGAELTQHPEMFRVVISYVGIYDMLRVELDPNGAYNVTEFGTVTNPAQFRALYAYSPYHHVRPGAKYPAVLFITGDNDPRVNPAHSRKMLAELQADTGSGRPVMLLTSANAGHGLSTNKDERLAQEADITAFLWAQLGLKPAAPAGGSH
jgi:prolyl oligopeptidase